MIRPKFERQAQIVIARPATVQMDTKKYYDRYDALSRVVDENPNILDAIHKDIEKSVAMLNTGSKGPECRYSTDQIFRMILVESLEGFSLRETCVRIDDSCIFREFTRIGIRAMIHSSSLCTLKNAIKSETWKSINAMLAQYAVGAGYISGEKLRLDTTAVETNIHYPTDSRLLSDCSRVLCRHIKKARIQDPDAVGTQRLRHDRTKKVADRISRSTQKKKSVSLEKLKPDYEKLVSRVETTLSWTLEVAENLRMGIAASCYETSDQANIEAIITAIEHFGALTERVLDQTRRRVFHGEAVPSDEKVLSIFEPHTELIVRGKAGKRIEYGHMIQIQQVSEKFITDFEVFEKKPVEHQLIDPALESHVALFGTLPSVLTADKGYYENMTAIRELEAKIEVVGIGKKGKRNEEETVREHSFLFRLAQRFRAGAEGSISYLKRCFRILRCFNKGWAHYVATVGATIFAHNLILLTKLKS